MGGVTGLSGFSVNDYEKEAIVTFVLNGYDGKEVQNVNVILYFKVWIQELDKEISVSYVESINGDLVFAETVAIVRYEP